MFILAACYTNGYGVKSDYEAAKSTIRKAAHDGHYISMAYVYRICHSLFPEFQPSQKEGQGVCDLALLGCRAALEDLPELLPADVVLRAKWLLKSYRAGVGADWYTPPQMLYQLSWDTLLRALDLTGEARAEVLEPHKIISMKVNKRGDSLLHFASSCANSGALEALLSDVPFDIDSCNDQGDTALLCASRAGQVENTMLLLDRRAKVNKAALTGETPLHWLISFAGEDVSLVGRKLIQSGANFEAKTVGSVAHSNFPASLEVDRLYRGTPLEWAVQRNRPDIVHFLLDEVQSSSTFWSILSQQQQPNALGWAAFYHHAECLNVMLQAMEEASLDRLAHGYMMQPLLALATSGADLFSMLLRHGSQWKQRLSATFDLLLRKSRRRNFFDGIGDEFGGTLLYHAIAGAHDTVVEYLLSTHVEQLLSEPTLEIAPASRSFPTSRGQQGNEGAGPNTAPTHPAPSLTGQGDTGGSHGFLRGMFAFLHALYTKIRTVIGGTQSAAVDAAMTITFSPPDPQRNKAGAFNPEDILRPCATSLRPPILEAIRWNRKHIYDLLLLHGADANAKSRNPFHSSSVDWTAIHTFAYAGHNADFSILKDLIHNQHHPVEGRTEGSSQTETPLLTSLCSNSFNLSNFLLSSGADINSCSTSAGLLATEHPTTILGHIIASSANGSIPRLECLCSTKSQNVEFIVEPARKLTALHRCAMGNVELWSNVDGQQLLQHECNFANNRDIMIYLLQKWGSSEEINRKCELDGATALHLAVVSANAGAVQELLATGKVDKDIKDIDGETAEQWCIKLIRHLESMAPRYAGAAPDVFENSIGPLRDIREMLQSPSMG
jgi:ankyrin repeat protein